MFATDNPPEWSAQLCPHPLINRAALPLWRPVQIILKMQKVSSTCPKCANKNSVQLVLKDAKTFESSRPCSNFKPSSFSTLSANLFTPLLLGRPSKFDSFSSSFSGVSTQVRLHEEADPRSQLLPVKNNMRVSLQIFWAFCRRKLWAQGGDWRRESLRLK